MSTLVDHYLARPDFAERHEITIAASRERVWAALPGVDARELKGAGPLFALRGLISRILHGHPQQDLPTFITLAEDPGVELVQGLVGQWWKLGGSPNLGEIGDWAAFAEPGYAKATFSFHLTDLPGGGVRLVTETRVLATSPDARRAMGRYWRLIRPGSGLIRRVILANVRARALRG